MLSSTLRSKRVIVPSLVAVLALLVGGVVWAASASADLSGSERDRVVAAAKASAGDGEVVSAETSDRDTDDADPVDRAEAYEVELRKADGSKVEVTLDKDLTVLEQHRDDDENSDATDAPDADDRLLSASERTRAEQAATKAVGGGTATSTEASDDRGAAYDVEVRATDGTEWDVDLNSAFAVVGKRVDR